MWHSAIIGCSKCNKNHFIMITMIKKGHNAQAKQKYKAIAISFKVMTKLKLFFPETHFPVKIERWNSLSSQQRPPGASCGPIPLDPDWTCHLRVVVLVEELSFCVSRPGELVCWILLDIKLFQQQLMHSRSRALQPHTGLTALSCWAAQDWTG